VRQRLPVPWKGRCREPSGRQSDRSKRRLTIKYNSRFDDGLIESPSCSEGPVRGLWLVVLRLLP
jgi:hypothetical protein